MLKFFLKITNCDTIKHKGVKKDITENLDKVWNPNIVVTQIKSSIARYIQMMYIPFSVFEFIPNGIISKTINIVYFLLSVFFAYLLEKLFDFFDVGEYIIKSIFSNF